MENHNRIFLKIFGSSVFLLWMLGCNENAQNIGSTLSPDTAVTDTNIGKVITLQDGAHCFAYAQNNDSVFLSLTLKDSFVTGNLQYRLYEKDANSGTIKGAFHGDTLLADYTFLSEGVRSLREVAFLRKGNILQEGTGDLKDNGRGLVFSKRSEIDFTGNIILQPVNCKTEDK